MSTTTKDVEQPRVMKEMSFLDRWLPVWILAAMAVGLLLGRFVPGLNTALEAVKIGYVSLPTRSWRRSATTRPGASARTDACW